MSSKRRVGNMIIFTLTIIRHGETSYNKSGIIQGHMDTDLSDKGRKQARLCGQRLQNEKFTHVYASDLKRAVQTCDLILEANKPTKCPVIKDRRLRERNFGIYQGRTRDEFRKELRRLHRKAKNFTPPGGEDIQAVRQRSVGFFKDVCKQLRQLEGEDGLAADLQTPADSFTSASNSEVFHANNDLPLSNNHHETHLTIADARDAGHSNSGSTSSTSGYSSTGSGSLERLSQLSPLEPPDHLADVNRSYDDDASHVFTPHQDADILSHIRSAQTLQHGSPNVSLSPIFEDRQLRVSSISSGRNSSFDDGDIPPAIAADILVVSHGGLMREIICYFVEELGCSIAGGKLAYSATPYNTAISKFTVSLYDNQVPRITCLFINDDDHLIDLDSKALDETEEA